MKPVAVLPNGLPAERAGGIHLQPRRDAVVAEHVLTGQDNGSVNGIHANRALRISLAHGLLFGNDLPNHLCIRVSENTDTLGGTEMTNHSHQRVQMQAQNEQLEGTPFHHSYLRDHIEERQNDSQNRRQSLHYQTLPCPTRR